MNSKRIRRVLEAFDQLGEQGIGELEHDALAHSASEGERALLYALRISATVPKLRRLETVASRWSTSWRGAGDFGLEKGRASPDFEATRAFLEGVYVRKFTELTRDLVVDARAELETAAADRRETILNRARRELQESLSGFLPRLREVDDLGARSMADLDAAVSLRSPSAAGIHSNATANGEGSSLTAADNETVLSGPGPREQLPRDQVPGEPPSPARPSHATPPPTKLSIDVELQHADVANWAMAHSGVPIVSLVRIEQHSQEVLRGLVLEVGLHPDLGESTSFPLPDIFPDQACELGPLELALPVERLRSVAEAEHVELRWRVVRGQREPRDEHDEHDHDHDKGELARGSHRLELLAHNEWPGLRAPAGLLAVFVLPNHPVVQTILERVREHLGRDTSDDSIDGYQRKRPDRVAAEVKALYAALQDLGLGYIGVPASFESAGQKVRLPDVVLHEKMGNCLDLSLLFAACLEQMGLAPILVVLKTHAFLAVWIVDDRFPEGVIHDVERLRTQVKLSQVLPIEATLMVGRNARPLTEAYEAARQRLSDSEAFCCAIDIRPMRREGYRPLPVRIEVRREDAPDPDSNLDSSAEPAGSAARVLSESFSIPIPDIVETVPGSKVSLDPAIGPTIPLDPAIGAGDTVEQRFERWKQKLLDLSLRNRLLHFKRGAGISLPLELPDVALFEDYLAGGETFEIVPRPEADALDARDPALRDKPPSEQERHAFLKHELGAGRVHAHLRPAELLARGRSLDREARSDLEEGGAITLYAAIGLLKWFETEHSTEPKYAPLILWPAEIEFERRRQVLKLKAADAEVMGNVTLAEKMRVDFGLDLGALQRLEPDESGIDVPKLLDALRRSIQRMPRWEILEEVHLGRFSFTKFLMWLDLEANRTHLLESRVVRHIAEGGKDVFREAAVDTDAARLDAELRPDELPLVMGADSSQIAAVVSGLRGASFVLQGPPGTGKSQTITNLIAAALHAGKSVLFVSEKIAALDVVHRRLKQVGLDDFCLELHSNKSNKKGVVEALGRSFDRHASADDREWTLRSARIQALRSRLGEYPRALHAERPIGTSFYRARGRLMTLAAAPLLDIEIPEGSGLTRERFADILNAARDLAVPAARVHPIAAHPWAFAKLAVLDPFRERELRTSIATCASACGRLEEIALALGTQVETSLPGSIEGLRASAQAIVALTAGPIALEDLDADKAKVREARTRAWIALCDEDESDRKRLAHSWADAVFDVDVSESRRLFEHNRDRNALLSWFALRGVRKSLQPHHRGPLSDRAQVAADLGLIQKCQVRAKTLAAEQAWVKDAYAGVWTGDVSARGALDAVFARARIARARLAALRFLALDSERDLVRLCNPAMPERRVTEAGQAAQQLLVALESLTRDLGALSTALEAPGCFPKDQVPGGLRRIADLLATMRDAMPRLGEWCKYQRACSTARAAHIDWLVTALEQGEVSAPELERACERAVLEFWQKCVQAEEPALRDFDGEQQSEDVVEFRRQDDLHLEGARLHVVAALDARRPGRTTSTIGESEPSVLERERRKQRAHFPVRRLFERIPNLLPKLKPCLLMSPLSVAQYLPAEGRRFDLVVFDEASQIGTHDAIGAIGRGDQVVIVGDSRQLPPTTFFSKTIGEEEPDDENDVLELESVLEEAIAARIPQRTLDWHYRSRHETLIQFSNLHYYDSRLNIYPAARSRVPDLGVKWHFVEEGRYELGTSRSNPREAQALVAHLLAQLQTIEPGERTFGIVTFSMAQQVLILDLLDDSRRTHPEIEAHFSKDLSEPVFVKNLENVQGDERDEIYFSICYGPDESGRISMNFGPINRTGGERRLNVAVTRARRLVHVFSSMTHDRIDLNRVSSVGARHLRAYLGYAAEHGAQGARGTVGALFTESEFEQRVYERLIALGYAVDCQVGVAGYRIDLAVRHPTRAGEYVLGIECDGATYHSGATVRDRDRLRQEVLEGLGWTLHRIWSTDYWADAEKELERALAAIEAAIKEDASAQGRAREVPTRPMTSQPESTSPASNATELAPNATAAVDAPYPENIEGLDHPPLTVAERPAESIHAEVITSVPIIPEQIDDAPITDATPPTEIYRSARLTFRSGGADALCDPMEQGDLQQRVLSAVREEGPLHIDRLAQAVLRSFGGEKLTQRVRNQVHRMVELAAQRDDVTVKDDFVWPKSASPSTWTIMRVPAEDTNEDPTFRDPDHIPLEELGAAAAWYLEHSLSLPPKDLARLALRVFGLKKLTRRFETRMNDAIRELVQSGRARMRGDRVEWSG